MGSRIAPAVITGRVVRGGVAQSVTRRDGTVRIVLTVMPAHPGAAAPEGVTAVIRFTEPVPVAAGERAEVLICWLPDGWDYAGPMLMPCAAVLTCAHIRR